MRVFIQQADGPLFLSGEGGWVQKRRDARSFAHTGNALAFCFENSVRDARIMIAFEGRKSTFLLGPFKVAKPHSYVRPSTASIDSRNVLGAPSQSTEAS